MVLDGHILARGDTFCLDQNALGIDLTRRAQFDMDKSEWLAVIGTDSLIQLSQLTSQRLWKPCALSHDRIDAVSSHFASNGSRVI